MKGYYNNFGIELYIQSYVNFQNFYNVIQNYKKIDAIPIITYHDIVNGTAPFEKGKLSITTDLHLIREEMKYLHDEGYNVIPLNSIKYNPGKKIYGYRIRNDF